MPPTYPRRLTLFAGMIALTWLTFLLLSAAAVPARAEQLSASDEQPGSEQDPVTPIPEIRAPGMGGANITHYYLSTGVESLASSIDSFFGDRRVYDAATGTYVQLRGSTIYSREGQIDYDAKFRLKIDLPNLERKVKLSIESSDRLDDSDAFNRITSGTSLDETLGESDVSTTLQFFIKEKKRWNLSLRPGVKFSDPLETFIKLRFRRVQPFAEKWLSRGTIEVGYYSRRGWENEWDLDLERDIGKKTFFRSSSTILWREDYPGNQFLRQAFTITHVYNPRRSIAYEIGTAAETRPNLRDTTYYGNIRLRRDIHRGWLFFEIKPQLLFARGNHFKAEPSLALSLEMLFGGSYLEN